MFGRNRLLEAIQEIRTVIAVAATEQKHLDARLEAIQAELNKQWGQIQDLRVQVQLLEPRAQEVPMYASNIPMHVTDDEEDAKWQLDNGLIEKKDYEALLEQLGLEPNVEIEHY